MNVSASRPLCHYQPIADQPVRWRCAICGEPTSAKRSYDRPPKRRCPRPRDLAKNPCVHAGGPSGETVRCSSCRGSVRLKLFRCVIHGQCLPTRRLGHVACCQTCADYQSG